MGCCASDSALPSDGQTSTERLLGNTVQDQAASSLTETWGQGGHSPHVDDGRASRTPRRPHAQSALVVSGAGAVDSRGVAPHGKAMVPFFLPEASSGIPVSTRQLQKGKKNNLGPTDKPATLQLPLRLVDHENVEVVSAAAHKYTPGGSPRGKSKSRQRARTALSYFEPECIICLEGFDKSNPRIETKCRCGTYSTANSMHLACLFAWIEQQGGEEICPVCRDRIHFEGSD